MLFKYFNFSKKHILNVLSFSIPLIIGQLGQMLFNIGDLIVAGHYATTTVAALGVATGIMAPFLMVGIGAIQSVSAIAATKRGDQSESTSFFASSIYSSLFIGILSSLLLFLTALNLDWFNLQAEIVKQVKDYLLICSFSLIPALLFAALKEYLQAYDSTYFANIIVIVFNILNVATNYVLMFGKFGAPELGITGAAITTVFMRSALFIVLFVFAFKKAPTLYSHDFNLSEIKNILKLGLPIGLGTLTEVLLFSTLTILIGKMSVLASASHNIVFNIVSLTFMVPLALSSAASVKVGMVYGQKNKQELINFSSASILMAISYMFLTALAYLLIPELLMKTATNDVEVIEFGAKLFFFVALFQIPDGIQITLWGVLRGMGDTKTPMKCSLFLNWGLGLPLGCYLAYKLGMGAAGLWAGLAISLSLMSIVLLRTYKQLMLRWS